MDENNSIHLPHQSVGTVPAHITEKFAGAKPEMMAFVTEGYAKLTADEKDLVNKV